MPKSRTPEHVSPGGSAEHGLNRRAVRRVGTVLAGVAAIALVAVGCAAGGSGASQSGTPYEGDTLTFATAAAAPSLRT